MRTLVPADTLVYLETNDLGMALERVLAKPSGDGKVSKPDLSSLKGMQMAIAVTGFETSEQKVNDEESSAEIKPKFVAVIDTHLWQFQAVKFAEGKLGALVGRMLGDAKMGRSQKSQETGGVWITWGGEKNGGIAHALVLDSVIYFGNDEATIDNCLVVRKGQAPNLAAANKAQPTPPDAIASGYASTAGVAQIADIAGLKFASSAGDDPQVKAAVATVMPHVIRELVTEIGWTERKTGTGTEDVYQITMPENVSAALKDTEPTDFEERLRNAIAALISGADVDSRTRTQVAKSIAEIVKPGDRTEARFTATGMERKMMSETGLTGQIVALFAEL